MFCGCPLPFSRQTLPMALSWLIQWFVSLVYLCVGTVATVFPFWLLLFLPYCAITFFLRSPVIDASFSTVLIILLNLSHDSLMSFFLHIFLTFSILPLPSLDILPFRFFSQSVCFNSFLFVLLVCFFLFCCRFGFVS